MPFSHQFSFIFVSYFLFYMTDKNYIKLILGHIAIGVLIFLIPILSKVYAGLIIVAGLYFVISSKNKNNEALFVAAYIVGSEAFLRTAHGNPFHEFGKYFVIFFIGLGVLFDSIPKKTNPYWVYLLLLIPGIIAAIEHLKTEIRTNILFNISGPICLGICSLYMYKRKITFNEMNTVLLCIGLPVITSVVHLLLKCPLLDLPILATESNYILSGGYAPNQTATILGLGMFVFASRLFLVPSSRKIMALNTIIFVYIYYRALLTFSRGGTMTGIIIIMILFCGLLLQRNYYENLKVKIGSFLVLLLAVFWLTSIQSKDQLWYRYTDKNPNGAQKSEDTDGRQAIAMKEMSLFEKNPILGVGVGEGKEIRKTESGRIINSHSEITRMLAEHGILGMLSLLILIITPFVLFLKNKQNIFLLCFFVFWLLTINHSAMRVAAPAFIYALALLDFKKEEDLVQLKT